MALAAFFVQAKRTHVYNHLLDHAQPTGPSLLQHGFGQRVPPFFRKAGGMGGGAVITSIIESPPGRW
jgi:hypothetical protein